MKHLLIGAFLLFSRMGYSQSINVWKIGDLEKRVKNNSDTTYIVNFWATWCMPCVKELPDFDTIHTDYEKKKIKVLLVSLDFAEDLNKKVIPFLKTRKVKSEVVILDEVNGNYFIPKVSADWSGALPATWIVNTKKSVDRFFEKKITTEFLRNELSTIPN
jgi:thiol-disulfide isomerase/thioredoxin